MSKSRRVVDRVAIAEGVGRLVKRYRSVARLSRVTGISRPTLSAWLYPEKSGKRVPSPRLIIRLALLSARLGTDEHDTCSQWLKWSGVKLDREKVLSLQEAARSSLDFSQESDTTNDVMVTHDDLHYLAGIAEAAGSPQPLSRLLKFLDQDKRPD